MASMVEIDRRRRVLQEAQTEARELRSELRTEMHKFDLAVEAAVKGEGSAPTAAKIVTLTRRLAEVEVREAAAERYVTAAIADRQEYLRYHNHDLDGGSLFSLLGYVDEAIRYLRTVPAAKAASLDDNLQTIVDEIRKHLQVVKREETLPS